MKRINVLSAFFFSLCISACTEENKQKADDYITVDVTANYQKKEVSLKPTHPGARTIDKSLPV